MDACHAHLPNNSHLPDTLQGTSKVSTANHHDYVTLLSGRIWQAFVLQYWLCVHSGKQLSSFLNYSEYAKSVENSAKVVEA